MTNSRYIQLIFIILFGLSFVTSTNTNYFAQHEVTASKLNSSTIEPFKIMAYNIEQSGSIQIGKTLSRKKMLILLCLLRLGTGKMNPRMDLTM